MIVAYEGHSPRIDAEAWVAPDATVCGDVTIGAGARIMHGARLVAEGGGSIRIGSNCIVLENAVVRATPNHPYVIGDHCLIGPNSHVVRRNPRRGLCRNRGGDLPRRHYRQGRRSADKLHLRTHLEPGATVPIGWVAVGNPAEILPPDRHEAIWTLQKPLDFPGFVYGLDRNAPDLMQILTSGLAERLDVHRKEEQI